jgi:hypothetical protein
VKMRGKAKINGSPRSSKSMLRQLAIEVDQKKCQARFVFGERRIAEQKEVAERQTARAAEGNPIIRQALNATLADIVEREREVGAYRKRYAVLTAPRMRGPGRSISLSCPIWQTSYSELMPSSIQC